MPKETLQERVAAARSLAGFYRMERIAYFGIATLCALLSIAAAVISLLRPETRSEGLAVLTAAGGGTALAMNRILKMWERGMDLLEAKGGSDGR